MIRGSENQKALFRPICMFIYMTSLVNQETNVQKVFISSVFYFKEDPHTISFKTKQLCFVIKSEILLNQTPVSLQFIFHYEPEEKRPIGCILIFSA